MDISEFEDLNPEQLEAVTDCSRDNLLIIAGPGSGKTHVICSRIRYLIKHLNVPPEKILVVTFTRDAATAMQKRFQASDASQSQVEFGTFHSIFYQILKQSNAKFCERLATEKTKRSILRCLLSDKGLISNGKIITNEELSGIVSAISYYKNTGNTEGAVKKLDEAYAECFEDIFYGFEKRRKEERLMDFDDMVKDCGEMLKGNPKIGKYWSERFSYILLDELQDINPAQYDVIKLLKGDGTLLFGVGDDDQSIYGFRGAAPECLMDFQRDFNARLIKLNINYRSNEEIVEKSLSVIDENKNRYKKALRANAVSLRGDNGENIKNVEIKGFVGREEEYSYIAEKIKERTEGKIAVLFRTNTFMAGLADILDKEKIKYTMTEKRSNIYEHFIIRDIFSYLRLAYGHVERDKYAENLYDIINRPLRYINREAVYKAASIDDIKAYYMRQPAGSVPHISERIGELNKFKKDVRYMGGLSLFLAVKYVFKSIGYEKYLYSRADFRERAQEFSEKMEWIYDEAKKYESFEEWLYAKEDYERRLSENDEADKGDTEEDEASRVSLMTVHASKGLEFDTVFIADCNEGSFPHGRMQDTDVIEEERRIFYVGMTRAKSRLELLYQTGTKSRPRMRSRFLNGLEG